MPVSGQFPDCHDSGVQSVNALSTKRPKLSTLRESWLHRPLLQRSSRFVTRNLTSRMNTQPLWSRIVQSGPKSPSFAKTNSRNYTLSPGRVEVRRVVRRNSKMYDDQKSRPTGTYLERGKLFVSHAHQFSYQIRFVQQSDDLHDIRVLRSCIHPDKKSISPMQ